MPKDFFPLHCVFRKAQSLLCLPREQLRTPDISAMVGSTVLPSASQGKGLPLVASAYGPDSEVLRVCL